jgi:Putative phage serine protease XkdF
MEKKLPVYNLIVDDDGENCVINKTALVADPAIKRAFQAFKNAPEYKFSATDQEQRIVSGPLMIAGLPIYRNDEDGEYYVIFDADNIKKAAFNYLRKGFSIAVNTEHVTDITGVYMVESFLIDSKRGLKTPDGFDTMPEGSWFGSFKVDNDEIWQKIKNGEFTGFSVEGMFEVAPLVDTHEAQLNRIIKILSEADY